MAKVVVYVFQDTTPDNEVAELIATSAFARAWFNSDAVLMFDFPITTQGMAALFKEFLKGYDVEAGAFRDRWMMFSRTFDIEKELKKGK